MDAEKHNCESVEDFSLTLYGQLFQNSPTPIRENVNKMAISGGNKSTNYRLFLSFLNIGWPYGYDRVHGLNIHQWQRSKHIL